MKIVIETIPHDKQRYPTCGDWLVEADGTRHIFVSDTGDYDHAFLVGLHEMIEQRLCEKRGITQQQVDKFDAAFEAARTENMEAAKRDLEHGEISSSDWAAAKAKSLEEPGDDPSAPYRKEHFFATNIEALVSAELGVNWQEYEAALDKLG